MFKFPKLWAALVTIACIGAAQAQGTGPFPGIGRDATTKEVAAWDIDVRPDLKGLPAGSGSVAKGQEVWEAKCAHCHGYFGESSEFFSPIAGGISKKDLETGRVAKLTDESFPGRTTFMKVSTLSTVWDYINRAMPWTAPKTLSTEEVYAVTAFLLNLNGIVPDDFTLSDQNMQEVQNRMPNRNGMRTDHAMWPGNEFKNGTAPDTRNVACMKNCTAEPKVASFLPDFARNAHGNLAEQNRPVGAQRGADTSRPEATGAGSAARHMVAAPATPAAADSPGKTALKLLNQNSCTACHGMNNKIVGPSFSDIAKKHAGKAEYLAQRIQQGGVGVWGPIPMPAQSISPADAAMLADWLANGAQP
jgi:S-disulfanyl-L-cysteine oxidoreductase SoxD